MRTRRRRRHTRQKAVAQRAHARRRFRQRFGRALTRDEYDAAVSDIQSGAGEFVFRQSTRVKHWRLTIGEFTDVIAVYDSQRQTIVTFWRDGEECWKGRK